MLPPKQNTCPYYLRPCYLLHAEHVHNISQTHVYIIFGHVVSYKQYMSILSPTRNTYLYYLRSCILQAVHVHIISHTQYIATLSSAMLSPTCNACPYYLRPCYLPYAIHVHTIYTRDIFHSFQNYFYYPYFSLNISFITFNKIMIIITSHTIRKVLQCEA